MKLKKPFYHSLDLLAALGFGLLAIAFSFTDTFLLFRTVFGFSFIFFSSGYPLSVIFFPRKSLLSAEKFITSTSASLLLLYPAGVITTLIEGQTTPAIFQRHLTHSLISLFFLQLLFTFIAFRQKRKIKIASLKISKFTSHKILLFSIFIFSILTLVNLNRADVRRDEYDLGYQAYNLIDGILAKRKAFTVSFNTHPPLMLHIKHFTVQILEPRGLDMLKDWQFRVTESILGTISIIYAYLLTKKYFSKNITEITVLILAANDYMVFMGRFFERSVYLMPFAIASIFWFMEFLNKKDNRFMLLSGISLGAAFLVKASAFTTVMALLGFIIIRAKNHHKTFFKIMSIAAIVYLPVIFYNLFAYLSVGLMDSNFSRLFRIDHPFATPLTIYQLPLNLPTIASLLIDQYSVVVSVLFTISFIWVLFKKNKSEFELILLIWIVSILIFFSLTTVRAYYMVFITVPFAILSASFINSLKAKHSLLSFSILLSTLFYSSFYSYKTNIDASYVISQDHNDAGRTGTPLLIPSLNRHFSISARAWTENWGWKNLIAVLDRKLTAEDCLIVKKDLDNLAVRRYLWTNDKVKEHFFAQTYVTRYNRCPSDNRGVAGVVYYLSDQDQEAGRIVETIFDNLGNPRFYLFSQDKGNYT